MRWIVLLAVSSLAAASSACEVTTCAGVGFFSDAATLDGPGSIAYHVSSANLDEGDDVHGSYEGTLTNRDPEVNATAVLYRFIEPPSPDDLSGGEVLGERFLPAARERTYAVPLEDTDEGIPIGDEPLVVIDEWLVIESLDASQVEVELEAFVGQCKDGKETPAGTVTWERAW